jgi:hypothetical protein
LIIYLLVGFGVFIIGTIALERSPDVWMKVAVVTLGCTVILYGAWIVFKLPRFVSCPAKIAKNFRPFFSVILGVLIGSFFCLPLWIMLGLAVVSGDTLVLFLSVIAFWGGSSTTIIAAGTVSGGVGGRWRKKFGIEKLRELCGMVLMMVGVIFLINGLLL